MLHISKILTALLSFVLTLSSSSCTLHFYGDVADEPSVERDETVDFSDVAGSWYDDMGNEYHIQSNGYWSYQEQLDGGRNIVKRGYLTRDDKAKTITVMDYNTVVTVFDVSEQGVLVNEDGRFTKKEYPPPDIDPNTGEPINYAEEE